jgi:hypothetical protein
MQPALFGEKSPGYRNVGAYGCFQPNTAVVIHFSYVPANCAFDDRAAR